MNDCTPDPTTLPSSDTLETDDTRADVDKRYVWVAHAVYGIYAARLLLGLISLIGLVAAYICRPRAAGTYLESHFTYQIRTFWISFAGVLVGVFPFASSNAPLTYLVLGALLIVLFVIWFIYRIVKGWIPLAKGHAIVDPRTYF